MKLFAISDLHLANALNREALAAVPAYEDDWLILAGDVGESEEHLRYALSHLVPRFRQLVWVPGNHDLWTLGRDPNRPRGEEKYLRWVEICRQHGVLTPEDPYVVFSAEGEDDAREHLVAPLFLLYDYSFRPDEVEEHEAVAWAEESGIVCSDEYLLYPAPYPSLPAWCRARLVVTEERLERARGLGLPMILINHFPLRRDLLRLRRIPRFSIWCGTVATEDWHARFGASVVVYGHLHVKGTHYRDGVRFEEVSLGYPRDWSQSLGVGAYLRQILPPP